MLLVVAAAVFVLAVARLTTLVTEDKITEPIRNAAVRRLAPGDDDTHPLVTLLFCPWCLSMWIGFAAAPVAYFHHTNPLVAIAGLALAASMVTGMIASIGR